MQCMRTCKCHTGICDIGQHEIQCNMQPQAMSCTVHVYVRTCKCTHHIYATMHSDSSASNGQVGTLAHLPFTIILLPDAKSICHI